MAEVILGKNKKSLPEEVTELLNAQGFVIVSTIGHEGIIHNSCKGIVEIKRSGEISLMDLYLGQTFDNLKRNHHISLTAVDEHKFKGYCLQGKAKVFSRDDLGDEEIKAWEDKITSRLTRRLLKNIREEKGHTRHPEILLPRPEYMIVVEVEQVIDLPLGT